MVESVAGGPGSLLRRVGAFCAQPAFVVSLLVGISVFIPYVARVAVPNSSIHPVSFALCGGAVVLVLVRRTQVFAELSRHWPLYLLGLTVATVGLITTTLHLGAHGKAYVVNQMLAPLALFAIVQILLRDRPESIRAIGKVLVLFGCIQTVLAAVQVTTQSSVFFGAKFSGYSWFDTMIAENRAVGTFDHSLVLALYLLIALCFTPFFASPWWRWSTTIVLSVGMLLTQSRLGMVLAVAIVVLLIVLDQRLARFRIWVIGLASIGLVVLILSPLGQSLIGRFQNDLGSNRRRFAAIELYASEWSNHIFTGSGLGSSFDLTESNGLKSSLENPLLMMAVDVGLLWAVIWFGMQAALALGISLTWRRPSNPKTRWVFPSSATGTARSVIPLYCAAACALFFTQSFSSTAVESAASLLVWLALALLTAAIRRDQAKPLVLAQPEIVGVGKS